MSHRIEVLDDDTGDSETISVEMFCQHNADDAHICAAVRALNPGERVEFGGGAAPVFTVRRPRVTNDDPGADTIIDADAVRP